MKILQVFMISSLFVWFVMLLSTDQKIPDTVIIKAAHTRLLRAAFLRLFCPGYVSLMNTVGGDGCVKTRTKLQTYGHLQIMHSRTF